MAGVNSRNNCQEPPSMTRLGLGEQGRDPRGEVPGIAACPSRNP